MFKKDDIVFHPQRGAGIVTDIQEMSVVGNEEPYYRVELATGETLLTPVRKSGEAKLVRVTGPEAISEVLVSKPEALVNDFRQRTFGLEEKVGSGNPLQVAEALRDLAWRKHTARLSTGDIRLMEKARKTLVNALVVKPDLNIGVASKLLDTMLKQTVTKWDDASA